jgi:hypothetical protein
MKFCFVDDFLDMSKTKQDCERFPRFESKIKQLAKALTHTGSPKFL